MRPFAALLLFSFSFCSYSNEREIQRALIQRDQQSAEFARRGLENLHADQLRDAGRPPLPFERQQMAREREMVRTPGEKKPLPTDYKPLPLPGSGGPPSVAVPISTPSIGG